MEGNPQAKLLLEWRKKKKNLLSTDELCVNLSDRTLELEVYLSSASALLILWLIVLDFWHLKAQNMKLQ